MEITTPEDREICRSIDFAPRGPRDCPRAFLDQIRLKKGPKRTYDRLKRDNNVWKKPKKKNGVLESKIPAF